MPLPRSFCGVRNAGVRRRRRGALFGGASLCALALLALLWRPPLPALAGADGVSVSVLDRNGRLLRAYTTPDGRWRLPIEEEAVDQRYLAMLIALEDKRFRSHHGVDPLALARAGWQLLRHRRIVSGGSTLTMQVARLLKGEHERSAGGKIRQALAAIALEGQLSKTAILTLYLRLAPFGGNLEGVRAAALAYFGKEPLHLSPAEAALLVALPQSPKTRRPDRFAQIARRARNRVLDRAATPSRACTGCPSTPPRRPASRRSCASMPWPWGRTFPPPSSPSSRRPAPSSPTLAHPATSIPPASGPWT
jgi:penicillin-binding protein 1C